MLKTTTSATLAAILFSSIVAMAAPTAEQKCEGGKNQAAGKYAACVAKAEKGLVTKGDPTKYGEALVKCDEKLTKFWDKLELQATDAGTVCPSTADQAPVSDFLDVCGTSFASALAGGTLGPDPVTCDADLTACGSDLSTTNTDLGTCNGNLSTCSGNPRNMQRQPRHVHLRPRVGAVEKAPGVATGRSSLRLSIDLKVDPEARSLWRLATTEPGHRLWPAIGNEVGFFLGAMSLFYSWTRASACSPDCRRRLVAEHG